MNIQDIVQHLRTSMFIQDPTDTVKEDPEFFKLSEDYLLNVLDLSLSKVNPSQVLSTMERKDLYPTILMAKKEIYYHLATRSAPLYSIGISGGNVQREQRFDHYMRLIEQVDREYTEYLATGIPVQAHDILISSRYYSKRNYDMARNPDIELFIDEVYKDKVEVRFHIINVEQFYEMRLYISESPIVDIYENKKIDSEATLIKRINDKHINLQRISDLKPSTEYHVAIVIKERNGLEGFDELTFVTLGEESEGEENES